MQPYQKANEEIIKQGVKPLEYAKEAASFAAGAGSLYAGTKMATKVLPFLNKYIPEEIATKALSKVDPRIGKFIEMAKSAGHQFDEIKSFIQNTVEEPLKENAKQDQSIIKQYSPELHNFIDQAIQKGQSPIEAASEASRSKKFEKEIKKMVHDHKLDWTSIVESVFGKGGKEKQQMQQPQEQQQPQEMGQPEQPQPMQAAQGMQAPQAPQAPQMQGQPMQQGQQQQMSPKLKSAYQKLGAYLGG